MIRAVDGHDPEAVAEAIRKAKREKSKPTLICCKTIIGYGAPNKQGKEECHGAALGADEVALARKTLGWPHEAFVVPDDIRAAWDARAAGKRAENRWRRRFKAYQQAHPELAAEFLRRVERALPENFDALIARWRRGRAGCGPGRRHAPELAGRAQRPRRAPAGTARRFRRPHRLQQHAHKGCRTLYAAARPERALPALRRARVRHGRDHERHRAAWRLRSVRRHFPRVLGLCAQFACAWPSIIEAGSIFVLTHDSIGLGEDGPTHQPIEHLASLRMIPRMEVWRPCDTAETWVAWGAAIARRHAPTVLALTRQSLPQQARDAAQLEAIGRGGYVLVDCAGRPDCILIATGSEVAIAVDAARALTARGRRVRVVSMPCTSVFDAQDAAWRASVLPPA